MNVQERLRLAVDQQQGRLREEVPPDRQAAILALIRAQEQLPLWHGSEVEADLVTGRRLSNLGGNKALQLCLESAGDDASAPASIGDGLNGWAERFARECGWLAEAELVLAHCETGFMRMVDDGSGAFDAWIATKRPPTSWRERADIDWWASWLARQHEPELRDLQSERRSGGSSCHDDASYRRIADIHLTMMSYQLGYPPDTLIGGCTVQTYRDVLGQLIAWALQERDRGEVPTPRSEHSLVAALASALTVDPAVIAQALAAFTLDRENAAYHAAVPGVAAAPLVRVDPSRLVWSVHGLTTDPFLFLTRELKRRAAQEYHNS